MRLWDRITGKEMDRRLRADGIYLKHTGWGPFVIPGEERRIRQAHADAKRILAMTGEK